MVIYSNLTHLARHEFYAGVGDGIAKCPFDPEDNSTAIWVKTGNPGGHPALYSGTNAEFTKADAVIFRGDIFDQNTGRREYTYKRTIKYDSHMLDKPDFVGSYEVGDYVYFFFRETAVEYMNCGKTIYSRIARVCKKDTGGKNILHQNWATYLKARLNCSIPGEFPFFFNEIQDIFKPSYDDTIFHAVFSTNQNGLHGSAICSFKLDDIEEVFDGKFKEQATSTSMWLPVPSARYVKKLVKYQIELIFQREKNWKNNNIKKFFFQHSQTSSRNLRSRYQRSPRHCTQFHSKTSFDGSGCST